MNTSHHDSAGSEIPVPAAPSPPERTNKPNIPKHAHSIMSFLAPMVLFLCAVSVGIAGLAGGIESDGPRNDLADEIDEALSRTPLNVAYQVWADDGRPSVAITLANSVDRHTISPTSFPWTHQYTAANRSAVYALAVTVDPSTHGSVSCSIAVNDVPVVAESTGGGRTVTCQIPDE